MRITDHVGSMLAMQTRAAAQNINVQTEDESDATATMSAPATSLPPPAQSAASADDTSTSDGEPKSAFDRIVEVGFTQYAAELEAQKLKEMREKILLEMGLSEEALAKMSPEQRGIIEKMIAEEIARRIEGSAALNDDTKEAKLMPEQNTGGLNPVGGGMGLGATVRDGAATKGSNLSMGLGPLLALQEINQGDAQTAFTDGQEKVGKKDPSGL